VNSLLRALGTYFVYVPICTTSTGLADVASKLSKRIIFSLLLAMHGHFGPLGWPFGQQTSK
jgi:hypothetical protein